MKRIYLSEDRCPEYLRVDAHYERIDPRNRVKNSVPEFNPFGIHFHYAHYVRIDLWNAVYSSVSRVEEFIMRIYFVHVFGVTDY